MKRLFDIILVLAFAAFWVPLLLVIGLLCKIFMGSPVVFKQMRPGLRGKGFLLYKFRTMSNEYDEQKSLLPDQQRLTKFGELLRRTSLDELPELWNVLKGDMSLVGPRPLLMEYLERYTPHQARRHEALPGMTGWAQVNGRASLLFAERFKLDLWYVEHQSLWLDMKILFLTVWKCIAGEGMHKKGEPMEVFLGTKGNSQAGDKNGS